MKGESAADLAKEFKVGRTTIIGRFNDKNARIKDVANQVLAAEKAVQALPVSDQVHVFSLADELRAISTNLAGAAKHGSITSFRMAAIARKQSEKVNTSDPMETQEALQAISALTKISNEAASLGMNLINANKETMAASNVPLARNKTYRIIKAEDMKIGG